MSDRRKALRCAVYTRKSSDEGLEQAFNSLHAQREACEAYVVSQRSEGWVLVPTHYDDGGFSDGALERPAPVKTIARGHAWFDDLVSARAKSIRAIARREGLPPRYVSRLLALAFLPPKLMEAILAGAQPAEMTAETLTRGERGVICAEAS